MTDPYLDHLASAKRRWEGSSFLLQNQVTDLREIEQSAKGKWKQVIGDHIQFVVQMNNEAYEIIESSDRLHRLQQFRIGLLEETIARMASSPDPYRTLFELKKQKNAEN